MKALKEPILGKDLIALINPPLHEEGIYKLSSHGWLNADDRDPAEVGHAMWQADPPPGLDWGLRDFHKNFQQDDSKLPVWRKAVAANGEDFEGLLEASRLSIGLALLNCPKPRRDLFADEGFFNLHWLNAMLTLEIASDRLRSLFISCVFRDTIESYEKQHRKNRFYATPFENGHLSSSISITEMAMQSLQALPNLAHDTFEHIRIRNELVHTIATDVARQAKARLEKPPVRVEVLDLREHQLDILVQDASTRLETKLDERVAQCCGWYKTLIEMSNHVFVVENQTRER